MERIQRNFIDVKEAVSFSDSLSHKRVKLGKGGDADLLTVFLALVLEDVRQLLPNEDAHVQIMRKMRDEKAMDTALNYLKNGYNPVLLYDGDKVDLVADFLVSHRLSDGSTSKKPYIVLALIHPIRRALARLGAEPPEGEPNAYPATKIVVKDGDVLVEYSFFPVGLMGFELVRETARVVGSAEKAKRRRRRK